MKKAVSKNIVLLLSDDNDDKNMIGVIQGMATGANHSTLLSLKGSSSAIVMLNQLCVDNERQAAAVEIIIIAIKAFL